MKSVTLILAEVKGDLMPFTQSCIRLLGAIKWSDGKFQAGRVRCWNFPLQLQTLLDKNVTRRIRASNTARMLDEYLQGQKCI